MKNVNNDYSYIFRMLSARKRAEEDYLALKRESENIMICTTILIIDFIIGIFAWLVYYT